MSRSKRGVLWTVAGSALLIVGCLIGATFMSTPAQIAASALPPAPSIITAPVENRIVANQVITRGQVIAPDSVNLLANHPVVAGELNVVTAAPLAAGSEVTSGMMVIEISGRPQFVLSGAFPAYRDLSEGAVGPDVSQLQVALNDIGFSTGKDTAGTFGAETAAAVGLLYTSNGYAAQTKLPLTEVVFVPTLPATLETSNVAIGALSTTSSISLEAGALEVTVKADEQILALASVGLPVQLTSEVDGVTVNAAIAGTSSAEPSPPAAQTDSSTGASDGEPLPSSGPSLRIVPVDPLPATWRGQDIRVTIADGSSDGEVLAVPVSAVFTAANGTTNVIVIDQVDGEIVRRHVQVRPGAVGEGYVEVTALGSGPLAAGDEVMVGSR